MNNSDEMSDGKSYYYRLGIIFYFRYHIERKIIPSAINYNNIVQLTSVLYLIIINNNIILTRG